MRDYRNGSQSPIAIATDEASETTAANIELRYNLLRRWNKKTTSTLSSVGTIRRFRESKQLEPIAMGWTFCDELADRDAARRIKGLLRV